MIGTARDVTTQRRAVDRLRELDHQRGQLLERMLLTEEEERGRIARALHDDTVQLMAALQINLDRIQRVLGGESPRPRPRWFRRLGWRCPTRWSAPAT